MTLTADTLTVEQVEALYEEAAEGTALHRACGCLLSLWDDGPEGPLEEQHRDWRQWVQEAQEDVVAALRGRR